jgi:hypothetical protein
MILFRVDGQDTVILQRDSDGVVLEGLSAFGHLGNLVCSVSDVNGDGYGDVLVLGGSTSSSTSGSLYLIFGSPFSKNLDVKDLSSTQGIKITGSAFYMNYLYTHTLACGPAGDVNADGFNDFVIGASYGGTSNAGVAYIIYGKSSYTSIDVSSLAGNGITISSSTSGLQLGYAVAAAGDVDGDGYADVLITSYGYGYSFVYYGSTSPSSVSVMGSVPAQLAVILGPWTIFGWAAAGIGDMDGDGLDDIMISCPICNNFAGYTYVIWGKALTKGGTLIMDSSSWESISVKSNNNGFVIVGGGKTTGSLDGDFSGCAVSSAGDFNGDGTPDILIGASSVNLLAGAAYVIFGSSSMPARMNLATLKVSKGFPIYGENSGDHFGNVVSRGGDVNGDGYDDIIIGAPFGKLLGTAYVIFGAAAHSAVAVGSMPSSMGFACIGTNSYSFTGHSVSGGYDVNKDGYDDIVIGAPDTASFTGTYSGVAYIVYGQASESNDVSLSKLTTVNTLYARSASSTSVDIIGNISSSAKKYLNMIVGVSYERDTKGETYVFYGNSYAFRSLGNLSDAGSSAGIRITGAAIGDYSGTSVSSAGDVDNDGWDDIIVGAPGTAPGTGKAYILYGGNGLHSNIELAALTSSQGFSVSGAVPGAGCGYSVSNAGDVNNDGYDDAVIGCPSDSSAYVIYGGARESLTDIYLVDGLSSSRGFLISGGGAFENTGYSVGDAGDVNGDGYSDIVVGIIGKWLMVTNITLTLVCCCAGHSSYTGAVAVIFGKAVGTTVALNTSMDRTVCVLHYGARAWDKTGYSVSGANDVNADGYADIVVGAPYGNQGTGCAYIIFGSKSPTSVLLSNMGTSGYIVNGESYDDSFGESVNRADDINGDGLPDVIIGAPGVSSLTGYAYIVYGQVYQSTIEVSSMLAAEGMILVGGTFAQRSGWSVAAAADSLNNIQVVVGTSPIPSTYSGVTPSTSVFVYIPGSAVTGLSLTPTVIPTPAPSSVPTTKPTTSEPSTDPSVSPSAVPTDAPTTAPSPMPSPRPTTLWTHEKPVILGTVIPFLTATLPFCFSRQICGVVLDNYGTETIDEDNNPTLIIIHKHSGISMADKPSLWISWIRQLCDAVYGTAYKNDKIMQRDFSEKYIKVKEDDDLDDAEFPVEPPLTPLAAGSSDPYHNKDLEMQIMGAGVSSLQAGQLSIDEGLRNLNDIPKETADVEIYLVHSVNYDSIPPNLLQLVSPKLMVSADNSGSVVPALTEYVCPSHVTDRRLDYILLVAKVFIENYPFLVHSVGGITNKMKNDTLKATSPSKTMLFTAYVVVAHASHVAGSGFNYHVALANTLAETTAFGSRLLTGHVVQQQYQLLSSLFRTPTEVLMYCEASILSVNAMSYITVFVLRSLVPFAGVTVAPNTEYSFLMSTSIGATHCLAVYHSAYDTSSSAFCVWLRLIVDAVIFLAMLRRSKFDVSSVCATQQTICHLISVIYAVTTVDMLVGPALSILGVSGAL